MIFCLSRTERSPAFCFLLGVGYLTLTIEHLVKTLNALNNQFQNESIVRDTDRSLFFSGIMIALKDPTFRASYRCIQKPSEQEAMASDKKMLEAHNLSDAIVEAVNRQLNVKVNNLSTTENGKFSRNSYYKYKAEMKQDKANNYYGDAQ